MSAFLRLASGVSTYDPKKYKASLDSLRNRAYDLLGRACMCCGEARMVFLNIDHVHNDGAAERKRLHGSQSSLLRQVIKTPSRYQILCRNCNWAKRFGDCPHGA